MQGHYVERRGDKLTTHLGPREEIMAEMSHSMGIIMGSIAKYKH